MIEFFMQKPLKERVRCFRLICDLLNFKGEAYLCGIKTSEELSRALEQMFEQQMNIKIDKFAEKYEKTIMTWRNKEAIFTYAGKINQLFPSDKAKAIQFYKDVLTLVLEGTFCQKRYQQRLTLTLLKSGLITLKVFQKWQQPVAWTIWKYRSLSQRKMKKLYLLG